MKVKDEICKIEGMVSSLLFKLFKNDIGIANQKIIILDSGSNDGTFDLLKSISQNENSVLVLKNEELSDFMQEN